MCEKNLNAGLFIQKPFFQFLPCPIHLRNLICSVNSISENYQNILDILAAHEAELVAVSKMQSSDAIKDLYHLGQRDFGENYVQECCEKQALLPGDIRWHFIGHLQTNKVKQIASFVYLIHGVDSLKLLKEIDKQAEKCNRIQPVLIQIHIAKEDTKFGFSYEEAEQLFKSEELNSLKNIKLEGLMGMASTGIELFALKAEFSGLHAFYEKSKNEFAACKFFKHLSMGMTSDYRIALDEGSNMVRIGSAIFGERNPEGK